MMMTTTTKKKATKKKATRRKPTKTEVLAARGKPPEEPASVGRLKGGATQPVEIMISRGRWMDVPVLIEGTAPLMQHAWSAKAIRMMLDAQMNPKRSKKEKADLREAKNPWADFIEAICVDDEGFCAHRCAAFKESMISACRMIPNVTMANLKQAIRVQGEVAPLYGKPEFRMDLVRVDLNKPKEARPADVRFRPIYERWASLVNIRFRSNNISLDSVINLFAEAGESQGVGEMRPERGHNFGTWDIVGAGDEALRQAKAMERELGRTHIDKLTPDNTGMDLVLGDLAPAVREMLAGEEEQG